MGVSLYDKEGTQRRLEAMYVLTTAEGVEALLDHWDKFTLMPYDRGDYGVVDLIVDTEHAIREANLTAKQRTVVELHLMQGYTQVEVGRHLGVGQDAVSKLVKRGTQRIADVFTKWDKMGEY